MRIDDDIRGGQQQTRVLGVLHQVLADAYESKIRCIEADTRITAQTGRRSRAGTRLAEAIVDKFADDIDHIGGDVDRGIAG